MSEIKVKKFKVSVVGGAGFIGTSLCKRLHEKNILFEIIDLRKSDVFGALTKIGDVRSISSMRQLITGDVVINLAAEHRDDVKDISQYYVTNVEGAENLAKVCAEKKIRKIIFTSSVAVYGLVNKPTSEDGAINPFNDYGRSKHLAEEKFISWGASNEKNKLVIIRPTVVFGEGNRGNVYNLLNQIARKQFIMVGSGENKKSLAYVDNLAAFIEHAISFNEKQTIINYADSPDLNMRDLVESARKKLDVSLITNKKIPYLIGVAVGLLADILAKLTGKRLSISYIRIKKFCGTTTFMSSSESRIRFKPPHSLIDGLNKTIEHEFILPVAD